MKIIEETTFKNCVFYMFKTFTLISRPLLLTICFDHCVQYHWISFVSFFFVFVFFVSLFCFVFSGSVYQIETWETGLSTALPNSYSFVDTTHEYELASVVENSQDSISYTLPENTNKNKELICKIINTKSYL
jgi:hypothetical protein